MKKVILYGLMVLSACTKRLDPVIVPAPGTTAPQVTSSSAVSLLDLYSVYPADVAVNGHKLTTFMYAGTGPIGPTAWFPTGQMAYGQVFTIPDSLFDAQGNAIVGLYTTRRTISYLYDSTLTDAALSMHNNPDSPKLVIRYPKYLAPGALPTVYPSITAGVVVVPRAAQGPSHPENFKIRIVNMAGEPKASPYDGLTLTYADGTTVSETTTGVGPNQASGYAELPYGSLQLKIRANNGYAIEETPSVYVDDNGYPAGLRGMSYNDLRTFLPGGVYTLLVYWTGFLNGYGGSGSVYYPGVVLLKENSPASSPNYIRMQAVDALPGVGKVHFIVDGQDLGGLLDFGSPTDYGIFSIGPHKVEITDGSNKQLASTVFNSYSLDNITLWACSDQGKIKILTSNNDFSNTTESSQLSFGFTPSLPQTNGLGWHTRFLNLSDVPYVTFLDQTGTFVQGLPSNPQSNWPQSYRNLAAGYVSSVYSYVGYNFYFPDNYIGPPAGMDNGAVISVYQPSSATDTSTGDPLGVSLDHGMVANPELYHSDPSPAAEGGVYTIALIGRKGSADPADRLRLICIKHNK